MSFYDEIEPIHELPSDELRIFLDHALENLKFLWTYKGDRQGSDFKQISHEVDFDLQTVIHSIKKSLLFFNPDWKHWLSLVTDANEAMHLIDALEHGKISHYGFIEGLRAILKLYLQVGFYYPCDPWGEALTDYREMERGVFAYADIARHNYHERETKKAAPFIKEGERRRKQLHAPKEKRNKYILKYCRELKRTRLFSSAEHLLLRFPNRENAAEIDGAKVFKDLTEKGDLKAFCIMPDGKTKTVSLRKFQNYYKEPQKQKKG